MAKKQPKEDLFGIYLCFQGGKRHRAYQHHNMGASVIWCPKHGILCSYTARLGFKNTRDRQMTNEQYDKFIVEMKRQLPMRRRP